MTTDKKPEQAQHKSAPSRTKPRRRNPNSVRLTVSNGREVELTAPWPLTTAELTAIMDWLSVMRTVTGAVKP